MSSIMISGCGKLNSDTISIDNELKLNIIEFSNETPYRTQLVFLSHNNVTNFTEFVDALNYYYDKGVNLFTVSGVYRDDSPSKYYTPLYIFYNSDLKKEIKLMYKDSFTSSASKTIANVDAPPSHWSFYSI